MDDLDVDNESKYLDTDNESKGNELKYPDTDNELRDNESRDRDAGDEFEGTITMTREEVQSKGATGERTQIVNDEKQKSDIEKVEKELEIIYPTNYQYNNKRGSRNAICSVNLDDGNYLKKLFCCS